MRYGVREICDVVFKAKSAVTIGGITYPAGAPVLYIDSAKTSTLEGAATAVYATGGKGNARLLTWEGEKTLTFTVEDALLSPVSFAMLSGAGLLKNDTAAVKVHKTETNSVEGNHLTLAYAAANGCPIYIIPTSGDGDFQAVEPVKIIGNGTTTIDVSNTILTDGTSVFIDYYTEKTGGGVSELQIDAATFGGYYYVEASTLFTRQADGVDAPVEITIPKVKIQSNFTFTMASTGDPSTFTFTMDAMPDYTFFDRKKKVLCAMQMIEDVTAQEEIQNSVFDGQYQTANAKVEEFITYTVTVKDGADFVAGALVTANKDGKMFAADVTNSDGVATFAGPKAAYEIAASKDSKQGTGNLTNTLFTAEITIA